jgi:hypothetical protein
VEASPNHAANPEAAGSCGFSQPVALNLGPRLRKTQGSEMFFQIHKDGQAVDGSSYPSLGEASAALERGAQGGEVTEVDEFDRIVRRYTVEECRKAARKFRRVPS